MSPPTGNPYREHEISKEEVRKFSMGADSFGAWYFRYVCRIIVMILKLLAVFGGIAFVLNLASRFDFKVDSWFLNVGTLIAASFLMPLIVIGV